MFLPQRRQQQPQQWPLIALPHQRLLLWLLLLLFPVLLMSHGAWATGTMAQTLTSTPLPLASAAVAPLVSSSEATLLTPQHRFPVSLSASEQRARRRHENDFHTDYDYADKAKSDATDADSIYSADAATASTAAALEADAADADSATSSSSSSSKKRFKIMAVHTNCTRDLFAMRIELNRNFRGLVYAKDFPLECSARGNEHNNNVTLRLPTSGCGVRVEPRADGMMELSVRIMLQMEQKLRQSSDILRTVRCKLPPTAMGMTVMAPPEKSATATKTARKSSKPRKMPQNYRNGRMRGFNTTNINKRKIAADIEVEVSDDSISASQTDATPEQMGEQETHVTTTTSTPITLARSSTLASAAATPSAHSTPRVRIWLELGGLDGSGAVEVGQPTTLTVRAIVPGTMGVRVVDCAALDGLGESKQQLLDERGCTIDEQVMPPLNTHFKPADEGWSKHQADDLVEKVFSATFPAFKFPDRERLHVSCGVQLCKGKCPNVNCRTSEQLYLSADKHLARIEVFNSLAVTAPQIEVDRLRYDRHYNMSVEEYPPHIRHIQSEGTLCLSVSKLAISFCVLGLIFLVAVVVAIYSLIRARRRATHSSCALTPPSSGAGHIQRAELCTSMFSSSSESAHSARFGSKLFMPYYPNTLPYGRVY